MIPRATWVLLFVLGLSACSGPDVEIQRIQGAYPIEEVEIRRFDSAEARVIVRIDEGVDWRTLIDLAVFDEARPTMEPREIEEILGEPRQEDDGSRVFETPDGEIELTWVVDRSGDATYERWLLQAKPDQDDLGAIVSPEVLELIQDRVDPGYQIIFLPPTGQGPTVELHVERRTVRRIIWYRE